MISIGYFVITIILSSQFLSVEDSRLAVKSFCSLTLLFYHKTLYPILVYTTQVNSTFHAC